jgi:hypothetical protein
LQPSISRSSTLSEITFTSLNSKISFQRLPNAIMRSQALFSFALVAFASTAYAKNSRREPMPEDVKAAIVAAGQEFNPLSQRAADEMSELLAALPAGHGSES